MKRCGKSECRCARREADTLHGPYFYRYWRECGTLRKAYVDRGRAETVRAACKRRERNEGKRRKECRALIPEFKERMRTVERLLSALQIT